MYYYYDYIDGVEVLCKLDIKVVGVVVDVEWFFDLDIVVKDGDILMICGEICYVYDVYGYMIGYIVFYLFNSKIFCIVDSLMVWGCGCLFEGMFV